jgi:hypothetical protein
MWFSKRRYFYQVCFFFFFPFMDPALTAISKKFLSQGHKDFILFSSTTEIDKSWFGDQLPIRSFLYFLYRLFHMAMAESWTCNRDPKPTGLRAHLRRGLSTYLLEISQNEDLHAHLWSVVVFFFFFKTGSHYVVQASLELMTLLSWPPKGWNNRLYHHTWWSMIILN